jgi:hypothetical protein
MYSLPYWKLLLRLLPPNGYDCFLFSSAIYWLVSFGTLCLKFLLVMVARGRDSGVTVEVLLMFEALLSPIGDDSFLL